jgi:DNA-binding NarL/FixJ family response regulator
MWLVSLGMAAPVFVGRAHELAALRAGASGFLLKDTPPAGLLAAIRVIAAGDALLAPAITRRLIAEFARRPEPGQQPAATLAGVTDREREVLTLIARGLSNAEIAQALHVTMAAAKDSRRPTAGQARRSRPGPASHGGLRNRPRAAEVAGR